LITSSFVCISSLKVVLRLEITSFILDILWPLCLPVTHCMQIETCKAQHTRIKVSRNHEFQSGGNVVQEVKLRCKEHKEDFVFRM
jgi:hypothetical protein